MTVATSTATTTGTTTSIVSSLLDMIWRLLVGVISQNKQSVAIVLGAIFIVLVLSAFSWQALLAIACSSSLTLMLVDYLFRLLVAQLFSTADEGAPPTFVYDNEKERKLSERGATLAEWRRKNPKRARCVLTIDGGGV
jgi:hypothetical protein